MLIRYTKYNNIIYQTNLLTVKMINGTFVERQLGCILLRYFGLFYFIAVVTPNFHDTVTLCIRSNGTRFVSNQE